MLKKRNIFNIANARNHWGGLGDRCQQVNISSLGKGEGGVKDILKPERNCKTLYITPSIAFLGEGKWFYSWECSPCLLIVPARQNRDGSRIPISSCVWLHSFPSQPRECFHEEEEHGHRWMGPALSAPGLLLIFPRGFTMPCSWADSWWLSTGGKQSSDTFCCLKAPGSERNRDGERFRLEEREKVFMPAPFLNNRYG